MGIGVAAGLAVFLRSPSAYLVVFVGSVVRDIGDLVTELSRTDPSTGILGGISVFTIVGILGAVAANKAR